MYICLFLSFKIIHYKKCWIPEHSEFLYKTSINLRFPIFKITNRSCAVHSLFAEKLKVFHKFWVYAFLYKKQKQLHHDLNIHVLVFGQTHHICNFWRTITELLLLMYFALVLCDLTTTILKNFASVVKYIILTLVGPTPNLTCDNLFFQKLHLELEK